MTVRIQSVMFGNWISFQKMEPELNDQTKMSTGRSAFFNLELAILQLICAS